MKVYGIMDGYSGLVKNNLRSLGYDDVSYILQRGGTILGTSRCDEFFEKKYRQQGAKNLQSLEIDGLIAIGGDGTFAGARLLSEEFGVNVVGIPGTIDNDIYGTDYTIGFDTAMNTVIESIDKLRNTASSHHRIFLVEVMGKNSGRIALHAALASGAEDVFLPGVSENMEIITEKLQRAVNAGKSSIIVVAEGDESGGALNIQNLLRQFEWSAKLRVSVLGHIQRGGAPSYLDRFRATLLGNKAVISLVGAKSNIMIGFCGEQLVEVELSETAKSVPALSSDYLNLIQKLSVY